MRPLDPRLLRYARASRGFLALCVGLGAVSAVLIVTQATLLAEGITSVFNGETGSENGRPDGGWPNGAALSGLTGTFLALVAVIVARAVIGWAQEAAATRAAAAVKTELRGRLLSHIARLGPGWLTRQRSGELVALTGGGLDALDAYFARYLPQLALAALVPAIVLARILPADTIAFATIVLTLPLIPIFMILIGMQTERSNRRQYRLLARLSHHFLDVVAGLPTLKAYRRTSAQETTIRTITDEYRRVTVRTLRIAFLSSLVLELLATLSVALVAVGIGLRLVEGRLDLSTALLVLMLAPEAYLPLRQVGANFHASTEGLAAAEAVFEVLETPVPDAAVADATGTPGASDGAGATATPGTAVTSDGAGATGTPGTAVTSAVAGATATSGGGGGAGGGRGLGVPRLAATPLRLVGLTVEYPDRAVPAVAGLDLTLTPGESVALTGPSGSGKSTVLGALLGFVTPTAGRILVGDVDLRDLDMAEWRRHIAWVPQRPWLFAGSIAENIRLGAPDASDDAVLAAARAAGAARFIDALPDGFATRLADGGAGLSAGQRQRVALARAFLRDAPLVLLDEPTANLDGETEAGVLAAIRRLATGRTVLLAAHRPALVRLADREVRLDTVGAES